MGGVIPGGGSDGPVADDPARLCIRTSLMALDLLLALQPGGSGGFADAAAEARILSRRVATALRDMEEVMAGAA